MGPIAKITAPQTFAADTRLNINRLTGVYIKVFVPSTTLQQTALVSSSLFDHPALSSLSSYSQGLTMRFFAAIILALPAFAAAAITMQSRSGGNSSGSPGSSCTTGTLQCCDTYAPVGGISRRIVCPYRPPCFTARI